MLGVLPLGPHFQTPTYLLTSPTCPQNHPPSLSPNHPRRLPVTSPTRNACASTLMPPSGQPSSRYSVP